MEKVHPHSLESMRRLTGPNEKWAAYRNMDLGHPELGRLQFLKIGENCTYNSPPKLMPDTHEAINWRYYFVGYVNLDTGEVEEQR